MHVTLRLTDRPDIEVEFVLDTGFDGYLILPEFAVSALNLPYAYPLDAHFANGLVEETSVHKLQLVWDGEVREVDVLATGNRPLLGTLLMDGHDLHISFRDGGPITLNSFSGITLS